jgi:hypothetical protein
MAIKHTSEITFKVHLDENKIPEMLQWSAQDGGVSDEETKAFLISVWDPKKRKHLKWIFGQKICRLMK